MAAMGASQFADSSYVQHALSAPAAYQSQHTIELIPLAEGSDGTYQSLKEMACAVRGEIPPDYSGYLDPYNKRVAESICVGKQRGTRAEVAALFDYVIWRIKYVIHPINQQTVQDARRTLEIGSGDCVSLSVLLATLCASLGYPVQFVAQCVDGQEFSHVYCEVFVDGDWLALDAVAKDKPMGWRQPKDDYGFELPYPIFQ